MAKRSALQQARELRINDLKAEYHKLATQANRRMTMLEKLSQNPDYKAVLGYAYKDVAHELKIRGLDRFSHDIEKFSASKTDIRELKGLINIAEEFLNAPSSLKSGIDAVYRGRADTLNKKYGTDFSGSDMKNFFDSSIWDKLKNKFGSGAAMKTIAAIQKNKDDILQEISDARSAHRRIDFSSLTDIDGRDINAELTGSDKRVIENLAKIS